MTPLAIKLVAAAVLALIGLLPRIPWKSLRMPAVSFGRESQATISRDEALAYLKRISDAYPGCKCECKAIAVHVAEADYK